MEEIKNISTILDKGINFSVDAGIITRLGNELVGRAETAVSELVKNAFDADANNLNVEFIDTDTPGGTLIIQDDGNGMDMNQLINGFMRLSSSDKIHNPISPRYKRQRAGKKGIGRFATQRLGTRLSIISKTSESNNGLKLSIDWNKYLTDTDLSSIFNPIQEIEVDFSQGTKLVIEDLRDSWSEVNIKRIYRYVSDLLQPDFLSDRSLVLNLPTTQTVATFNVSFFKITHGLKIPIANIDRMVLDNALAIIEGYVLDGRGICEVVSKRFNINDTIVLDKGYNFLDEIHFKVYYFILNYEWYESYIPKMEYNRIKDFVKDNGGIKLYRNGFRVLPYGEIGNDWANIEKTAIKTEEGAYVPFSNNNFFGFVEIIDKDGVNFDETSSREGLIENTAFSQLADFINTSLIASARRINSARLSEKQNRKKPNTTITDSDSTKNIIEKLRSIKVQKVDENDIIEEAILSLEGVEMIRVLATVGLNIAEFTHEIRQFIPSFNGSINYLLNQKLNIEAQHSLLNLKENFNRFKTYTAFIDNTITQNVNREKYPQDLRRVVKEFFNIFKNDFLDSKIDVAQEYYEYDLLTVPMHPSEWFSILYNCYTNSKKAIKRVHNNDEGKIRIVGGRENGYIYLEFSDNGDGIPEKNQERIFDAFFTTSIPPNLETNRNDYIIGTGLGLKIVKDIVTSYHGKIYVANPEDNYRTCIRIEIPEITTKELKVYES
ncbi:ATP-binding protein [Cellulophaga sp. BC115SP]|uniref:sensor histidine kinase n=1 Tax=Cellulophaga sp. BC115SP TaxID=2683263 RepID=UPI0014132980|nr:ATP-binding protein [Cellulophaga sp. BC115SP]NBB29940.1 ATP-binding protein [Cellulophaga sp. BC115SP]